MIFTFEDPHVCDQNHDTRDEVTIVSSGGTSARMMGVGMVLAGEISQRRAANSIFISYLPDLLQRSRPPTKKSSRISRKLRLPVIGEASVWPGITPRKLRKGKVGKGAGPSFTSRCGVSEPGGYHRQAGPS